MLSLKAHQLVKFQNQSASAEKGISVQPLKQFRLAEMFEELRLSAEAFKSKTGSKPKIFLATMGR